MFFNQMMSIPSQTNIIQEIRENYDSMMVGAVRHYIRTVEKIAVYNTTIAAISFLAVTIYVSLMLDS